MKRPAGLPGIVLAWLLAMTIGFAPVPAAAVHPSFTTFNAPETTQLADRCQTEAVKRRIADLADAVSQLERKIMRIGRARTKATDELFVASDPARRTALIEEIIALGHWQSRWQEYQSSLKRQIAYYEALPHCGDPAPAGQFWPGDASKPTTIGGVKPIKTSAQCFRPPNDAPVAVALAKQAEFNNDLAAALLPNDRLRLAAALAELEALVAKRQAQTEEADALRKNISDILSEIEGLEGMIRRNNEVIQRELDAAACPPAPPPPPVTPPPPERAEPEPPAPGHTSVPLGDFETGVLAVLTQARADPNAYADGLRGARGRWAGEARDFLRARSPLPALVLDPALTAAALSHAQDLARRDTVGHAGADGSGVLARFHAQGHFVTLAAEVIAIRQATPEAVIRQLIVDEGHPGGPHRKDLFNPLFTRVGVAVATTRSHGKICVITLSNEPMRPES